MERQDIIEAFLDKPYWIIDILPMQVPAEAAGQYFKIERYFLSQLDGISKRFASVLVKLNCYIDIQVGLEEDWISNPDPGKLEQLFRNAVSLRSPLSIIIGSDDALITFSGDDHYMALYGPDPELLSLIRKLASGEGLFVWGPDKDFF